MKIDNSDPDPFIDKMIFFPLKTQKRFKTSIHGVSMNYVFVVKENCSL